MGERSISNNFDKGEMIVQQNMGIRIKGGATRNNPAKSFNLYARKKYGKSRIETDLFKDNFDINGTLITSYKILSVRAAYQEDRLRDNLARDLFFSRKGITTVDMKSSILFLNGEYWGLYVLQEKIGDDFIEKNYLVPRKEIVIAKDNQVEDGPEEEYVKFQEFCKEYALKDLSDDKLYKEIEDYIDIDSMIELFSTGIYIGNGDWPLKNDGEWKYLGEKKENNEYTDGKWRFIAYDFDYSMGSNTFNVGHPSTNMFNYAKRRASEIPVNLFFNLLKSNKNFQKKFVNVHCDFANDVFHYNKVYKLIKQYKTNYTEIITNSELRWWGWDFDIVLEGYAYFKSHYLKSLDSILVFFEERPKYTLKHLKEFIELEGDLVDLNIEIKGRGKIQINTITPTFTNGKWSGQYFSGIPITLKAIPDVGYYFREWLGSIRNTQPNIEIPINESTKLIAVFD